MLQEFAFLKDDKINGETREAWIHSSDSDFYKEKNSDKDNKGVGNMGPNYAIFD